MKQAVCALILNPDKKILGISRKNNPKDFGLPGGKVNAGETKRQALLREVEEETGLLGFVLDEIHTASCEGKYITTCYSVTQIGDPKKQDGEGTPKWLTIDELLSGSSFRHYNMCALYKAGLIKEKKVKDIKYIYIRKERSSRPLGCIAYQDMENGTFVYGYSALHVKDLKRTFDRSLARMIARNRLNSAISGVVRENGYSGFVNVTGDTINDKVADVLHAIHSHKHVSMLVQDNTIAMEKRLRSKKEEVAA